MSYKVIDNFLEEDMFRQIKVKMESQFFPWFYEPEIAKKGETLLKGQFISTGTCTKAHELIPNSKISADFGQFGKVEFFYK